MEKGGETTEAPRQQRSDLSKLLVFFFIYTTELTH
jgi:hypothetical protein